MKTLLITGIAGKSGLVLARLLAEGGAKEPWALRLAVRSEEKAEPVKRILPDAEYCRGDLTDAAYVDTLTKGVDVVLHIAGIGKSLLLAKAAAQNGVKRLVLVHTTGIYSKYKAAGEEYRRTDAEITALCREQGIGLTILRPTMIYGTLGDQNIVKFIKMVDKLSPMPVVDHANYLLQPVNCRDLGRAYLQVLNHLDETAGKNYTLSGRDEVLLIDLFRIIADELGVSRKYLSVPFPVAYAGAWGLYLLSLTKIDMREKVQRLCESRAYPHEEAVRDFGYDPMPFEEGLRYEVREYLAAKNGNN